MTSWLPSPYHVDLTVPLLTTHSFLTPLPLLALQARWGTSWGSTAQAVPSQGFLLLPGVPGLCPQPPDPHPERGTGAPAFHASVDRSR